MNSSSIGTRLNMLNLLLLLALCATAGAGIYGVVGLERMLAFVTGPAWQTADSAMETEIGVQGEMLAVQRVIRESGSAASLANFAQAHKFAEAATARVLSSGTLLSAGLVDETRQSLSDYATRRDLVLTTLREPELAPQSLDTVAAQYQHAAQQLLDQLSAVEEFGDSQVESRTNAIGDLLSHTHMAMGAASVAGLLLFFFSAWVTRQTVVNPLREFATHFRALSGGRGDLSVRMDESRKDEIGDIASGFNAFIGVLRSLMGAVAETSTRIANATQQVALTSERSNQNMRSQLAETEAVAAALTELAGSAQSMAHNTDTAVDATHESQRKVGDGRGVLSQVITTITDLSNDIRDSSEAVGELQRSSGEIGQVLQVIRDISEQTNLLALNAAIDAARAAEQGRGFAVVADEVRTLAQRTGESTAEINMMIDRLQAAIRRVADAMDAGRTRADHTVHAASVAGESLTAIDSAVSRAREMNSEIASAAREQSQVIVDVERNILRIQQGADRTATETNEVGRATRELSELCMALQSGIGQFKLH